MSSPCLACVVPCAVWCPFVPPKIGVPAVRGGSPALSGLLEMGAMGGQAVTICTCTVSAGFCRDVTGVYLGSPLSVGLPQWKGKNENRTLEGNFG